MREGRLMCTGISALPLLQGIFEVVRMMIMFPAAIFFFLR